MDEWDIILDFGECDGGSYPVQYEAAFGGHVYYIRYRHSWLTIDRDPDTDREEEEILVQQLAEEDADDGSWSDKETNVPLRSVGTPSSGGARFRDTLWASVVSTIDILRSAIE